VTVGDKTYKVALRFKQTYRPYRVELIKFSFDRWEGTQMARNFSSLVNVHDPVHGDKDCVLINMNDPLRHAGETFYQQSFDEKTEQTTVLQVVRNPGWLLPYIACVLVALGMMIHFGMHLVTFTRRRAA
jgi:cytochrome c biogenesis protein ResB